MRLNKNILQNKWAAYALAGCITVLFYLAVSNIGGLFMILKSVFGLARPILIGIGIAYVLNPFTVFLEQHMLKQVTSPKARHTIAVILALIAVLVSVVILLTAMIPQIINSAKRFIDNFAVYSSQLNQLIDNLGAHTEAMGLNLSGLTNIGNQALKGLTGLLDTSKPGNLIDTSFTIGMSVFNLVISCILAIYFLGDKDRLIGGVKRLMHITMSEAAYEGTLDFCRRCHHILIRYIIFDLVDGLLIAVINLCMMAVIGLPYKAVISMVVGITNLAPTFGPVVGCVIGSFILLLVNPWYALTFLIITFALQTVDGYILKPKLFGNTLGVPSVWILIVIIIGGRLFGVIGILLAIPVAAIADFMYRDFVERREMMQQHKKEEQKRGAARADQAQAEMREHHIKFE